MEKKNEKEKKSNDDEMWMSYDFCCFCFGWVGRANPAEAATKHLFLHNYFVLTACFYAQIQSTYYIRELCVCHAHMQQEWGCNHRLGRAAAAACRPCWTPLLLLVVAVVVVVLLLLLLLLLLPRPPAPPSRYCCCCCRPRVPWPTGRWRHPARGGVGGRRGGGGRRGWGSGLSWAAPPRRHGCVCVCGGLGFGQWGGVGGS